MSKAQIVLEIVTLLQGTPVDAFARHNFFADGEKAVVRCARETTLHSSEGLACKRAVATALRRYAYRFTRAQLAVLVDLYANALEELEPEAVPRVRQAMCDPGSEDAQDDAAAAQAVCERLSIDY